MAIVMSLNQKKYRISNTILLLKRASKLVREAQGAYTRGLTNGQDLRLLTTQLQSKLDNALLTKDDAYIVLNAIDTQFPYYIDIGKLSPAREDEITFEADATADTLKVVGHPDALAVFDTAGYEVKIERTNTNNDNDILERHAVTGHATVSGDSVLTMVAASVNSTETGDKVAKITLVET